MHDYDWRHPKHFGLKLDQDWWGEGDTLSPDTKVIITYKWYEKLKYWIRDMLGLNYEIELEIIGDGKKNDVGTEYPVISHWYVTWRYTAYKWRSERLFKYFKWLVL